MRSGAGPSRQFDCRSESGRSANCCLRLKKRDPTRFPWPVGFHHNPAVDALTKASTALDRRLEIAVLVPCLNEAAGIAAVVESFRRALPDARIYVYDNAST